MLRILLVFFAEEERQRFSEYHGCGAEEYVYIEAYAAVLHVVDIPLYPFAQLALHAYFAYVVFYLRHAGHTGQYFEAQVVIGYALGVVACVVEHVRPWAYDAHIAEQYVEELWCFIKVREAQEFAELSNAVVVNGDLLDICLVIDKHCTKLIAVELNAHVAGALLYEKYRAFGCELNK